MTNGILLHRLLEKSIMFIHFVAVCRSLETSYEHKRRRTVGFCRRTARRVFCAAVVAVESFLERGRPARNKPPSASPTPPLERGLSFFAASRESCFCWDSLRSSPAYALESFLERGRPARNLASREGAIRNQRSGIRKAPFSKGVAAEGGRGFVEKELTAKNA